MDIPDRVKSIVSSQNGGVHQRTFTFDIKDVERANEELDQFCEAHTVMGIVFDRVNNTLLYRCIYKN